MPVSGPRAEVWIRGVGHGLNWLAQRCAFSLRRTNLGGVLLCITVTWIIPIF